MIKAVGRVTVNPAAFKAQARVQMRRRVAVAAVATQNMLKQAVSKPGNVKSKRAVARDGAIRSKPGEPPMKQTGFGQRAISFQLSEDGLTAQVGIFQNATYMGFLEFGTRTIAPRPWLRPTLIANRRRIVSILGGGA